MRMASANLLLLFSIFALSACQALPSGGAIEVADEERGLVRVPSFEKSSLGGCTVGTECVFEGTYFMSPLTGADQLQGLNLVTFGDRDGQCVLASVSRSVLDDVKSENMRFGVGNGITTKMSGSAVARDEALKGLGIADNGLTQAAGFGDQCSDLPYIFLVEDYAPFVMLLGEPR